jgi:glutathione peroxidase
MVCKLTSVLVTTALLLASCGNPVSSGEKGKTTSPHSEPGHTCPMCEGLKENAGKADMKTQTPTPPPTPPATPAAAATPELLDITVQSIDGKPVNLSTYKGQVVLIVNVASKCGYTPQYQGLEKLYNAKKDAGLVVLGFPANDFLGQEPGSNEQIAEFCKSKYGVTFPMFEKITVTGRKQHELYKRLTAEAKEMGGAPSWNFTKYLIARDGTLVARFGSKTTPEDQALLAAIDAQLAKKLAPTTADKADK